MTKSQSHLSKAHNIKSISSNNAKKALQLDRNDGGVEDHISFFTNIYFLDIIASPYYHHVILILISSYQIQGWSRRKGILWLLVHEHLLLGQHDGQSSSAKPSQGHSCWTTYNEPCVQVTWSMHPIWDREILGAKFMLCYQECQLHTSGSLHQVLPQQRTHPCSSQPFSQGLRRSPFLVPISIRIRMPKWKRKFRRM